jgi:hypothetical protein
MKLQNKKSFHIFHRSDSQEKKEIHKAKEPGKPKLTIS